VLGKRWWRSASGQTSSDNIGEDMTEQIDVMNGPRKNAGWWKSERLDRSDEKI
jgi:hypothetical protein